MLIKRFLIAALLAGIVAIPSIVSTLQRGVNVRAFSDWDEPIYLPLLRNGATVEWPELLTPEKAIQKVYQSPDYRFPHAMLDVVLGKLSVVGHDHLLVMGGIFDASCMALSYLLFVWAFAPLTSSESRAQFGAFVTLCLPWLGSLAEHLNFGPSLGSHLTVYAHQFFPCLPVQRGLYTQFSYPLFAVAIGLLVRLLKQSESGPSAVVSGALGVVTGLSLYFYFFAWGSLLGLSLSALVIARIVGSRSSAMRLWGCDEVVFLLSMLAVALPGLLVLFGHGDLVAYGNSDPASVESTKEFFRLRWFFSPIDFGLATIALYCARTATMNRERRGALILIAAAELSKIPLFNLQPVLGRIISPYHFSLFYLDPVISGAFIVLYFETVRESFRRFVAFGVIALFSLDQITQLGKFYQAPSQLDEANEMFVHLSRPEFSGQRIATRPFVKLDEDVRRFGVHPLSYMIKATTRVDPLAQFHSLSHDRLPLIQRELLLAWIYDGAVELVAECPKSASVIRTDDLLIGAYSFYHFQRLGDCSVYSRVKGTREVSACTLVRSAQVDLVVKESGEEWNPPREVAEHARMVWTSTGGGYELWRVDWAAVQRSVCANPAAVTGLSS